MQNLETPASRRSHGPLAGVETAYEPDGGRSGTDRNQIAGDERGAA